MKVIVPLVLALMICNVSLAQLPSSTPAPFVPPNPAAPGIATPPPAPGSAPSSTQMPGAPVNPIPAPSEDDSAMIHKMLGSLSPHLVAALSMDNEANGSLIMSRPPARNQAIFSLRKRFGMDQGRQCADFSEPGTNLSVYGIPLGTAWTLAMWAKLPFTGAEAVLWRGGNYNFVCLHDNKFKSLQGTDDRTFGDYDKSWTGWHHVALTSDGSTHTLYIDAMPIGTVPSIDRPYLNFVGGQVMFARPTPPPNFPGGQISAATPAPVKPPGNYQCGLLDDMFIFDKTLTPEELEHLSLVRLPTREITVIPSPETPISNVPVTPASISTEGTALATELVKSFSNSLVFVSGTDGSGSGFIADMGGKPFLVTNAHVSAGVRSASFRTLQGTSINIGPASVAVGHDIFVMSAKTVDMPVSVMRDVGSNAAINDEIVVLGNAEGGGVINTITGRIVGIGPNLVEVDAPFQPGNSGSPIIHLKTKKAIGVATYLTVRKYDTATRTAIKDPVIRRFGYRLDSVKTWQPVDWNAFLAQSAEMENIEQLTEDFVGLIRSMASGRVSAVGHTNPVIRSRIDAWQASKSKNMSIKDAKSRDQNFLSYLKIACQTDVTNARQRLTYDYFLRKLDDQQRERSEIAGVFTRIIENIR